MQQSFLGITPWELHAAVSFDSEFSDSGRLPEQGVGFAVGKNLAWLHGVHLFAGTRHVLRRGGEADLLDSGETTSGEPEDARNEWFAGIVVATHHTIRITNEWNSMQAEHAWIESPKRLHWTPGLVWKLPNWGEAGIAVSLPLQGPSRSPWVTVSFTREFDGIFGRNVE